MPDKDLNDLHPELKPLAEQFESECQAAGINVKITETWRDPARENALHAEGITAATGSTCKHCFTIDGTPAGKAFDFIIFDDEGALVTDGTNDLYTKAANIGKALGLHWGGDFSHPDYDHFEIT